MISNSKNLQKKVCHRLDSRVCLIPVYSSSVYLNRVYLRPDTTKVSGRDIFGNTDEIILRYCKQICEVSPRDMIFVNL